jgi:hypothetical protein
MFSLRRVLVLLALLLALGASAAPAGVAAADRQEEEDHDNSGISQPDLIPSDQKGRSTAAIEMKPILVTSYQTGGSSEAVVETVVEIVPPTDEPGIIIVSVYSEAGPGVTDLSFTKHTDRSSPVSSGPSVSPPKIICVPGAGTLCPPD